MTRLEIDGSYGEGGGQILRNAAAYAAILGKSLRIYNVRANRSRPGLRPQHLTGLQLLTEACGGELVGGTIGSSEILVEVPASSMGDQRSSAPRVLTGDTQTAGSICLLLQAAIPFALFAPTPMQWILKGGTNASMAPQYDYWERIVLPTLQRRCMIHNQTLKIQPTMIRRGFYPKGGGEVHVGTHPLSEGQKLPPIRLTDRGEVESITIRSFYAGKCPLHVAQRTGNAAKDHLERTLPGVAIESNVGRVDPAVGNSSGILIIARTTTGCLLGGSALGSPKTDPRGVGLQAATELVSTLADGGCVDDHLQDQLIVYMVLAEGVSEILVGSLTLHTRTAIWTAEQCCGATFQISRLDNKEEGGQPDEEGRIWGRCLIQCNGIGFSRQTNNRKTESQESAKRKRELGK